jgi:alanine racemase
LATKPRVGAITAPVAPLSEVDIRTSIRPTVATVDLGAMARNVARLRATIGSGVKLWAVIKADAYGHGAVAVGRALEPLCDGLAVSLVEEGLELRAAGLRGPVMILGAYYNRHQREVIDEGLTPVVYDPGDLERFAAAGNERRRRVAVHLKVDTGMSRLGVSTDELPAMLDQVGAADSLLLAGLCTHFASADVADGAATLQALTRFRSCVDLAAQRGLHGLTNHAANSAAAVRFPDARLDAVRPGLALYGVMPSTHVGLAGVEPTLRLTTLIMALHHIPTGTTVSYGGLWRAARPSLVATLPIGYADGYPRHVRDAAVLVRGQRAPIVGAVCMDMLMVDVTDVPGAAVGDAVTLIGDDGAGGISVDDLARWAGTVSYEILCGISKRVPRVYNVASPRPVGPLQPPSVP